MSHNPYDRRSPDQSSKRLRDAGIGHAGPAITGDELNALARAAHMRGYAEASSEHIDELRAARARAWEEGHAAGVGDGERSQYEAMSKRLEAILAHYPDVSGDTYSQRPGKKLTRSWLYQQLKAIAPLRHRIKAVMHELEPPPEPEPADGQGNGNGSTTYVDRDLGRWRR